MYLRLFTKIKKIIPKISETELIALRSGGVSVDRDIFSGKINYNKLKKETSLVKNDEHEKDMLDKTKYILKKYGEAPVYPSNNINDVIGDLGNMGFFGMIIDKKYDGNKCILINL